MRRSDELKNSESMVLGKIRLVTIVTAPASLPLRQEDKSFFLTIGDALLST